MSFENSKSQNTHQPSPRQISLSQVVTETDLLTGSLQLEQAVSNGQHVEFCAMKAANCSDTEQENLWNFLMVRLYLKFQGRLYIMCDRTHSHRS